MPKKLVKTGLYLINKGKSSYHERYHDKKINHMNMYERFIKQGSGELTPEPYFQLIIC